MQLLQLEEALQATRRRTATAAQQLAAVSERTRALRRDLAQRRRRLEEGQRELASWQGHAAELAAEEGQRAVACVRAREALAREQRTQ
jgi:predicted  nucleic acid-binding Zn-ribbon protein